MTEVQKSATPAVGQPSVDSDAKLGSSVFVKGELTGSEDLTVDGRVEGRIELPDHTLTVGPNACIEADIIARVVTVFGTVDGAVTAREKVDIRKGGSVGGKLACERLAIQDGAQFCGKVEMPQTRSRHDKRQADKADKADKQDKAEKADKAAPALAAAV
jgi:cytoskeletal protein CcmA (bactofilin family)